MLLWYICPKAGLIINQPLNVQKNYTEGLFYIMKMNYPKRRKPGQQNFFRGLLKNSR